MRPYNVSDVLRSSISSDALRPSLSCVAEDAGPEGIFHIATDTHRLAILKMPGIFEGEPCLRFIYPENAVFEAQKKKFVNWRSVVPIKFEKSIRLPVDQMACAASSLFSVARSNALRVVLSFRDDSLFISARNEGTDTGVFRIRLGSEDMNGVDLPLNVNYLLGILPERGPNEVILDFNVPNGPVLFRFERQSEQWDSLRYLLMPMERRDTGYVDGLISDFETITEGEK